MSRKILPDGYMTPEEARTLIEDYLSQIRLISIGIGNRENNDFKDRIDFYADSIKEMQSKLGRAVELIPFSVEGEEIFGGENGN